MEKLIILICVCAGIFLLIQIAYHIDIYLRWKRYFRKEWGHKTMWETKKHLKEAGGGHYRV